MRGDLPSGTVTFLFTDVEGSTQLLHELGAEAYADTLAEHRRLIREACARHGGVEVDTQGDALFVSFPTAPGALFAAGEATEALASGPIRVRIGLHSGTPLLTEEGYVGEDVHRAARIASSAHGGQIILSQATRSFLEDGPELKDLGEHRFKDLAAPERVYQLGDGDFPPLKSLYGTNLPIPASSFLGRERELSELVALLTREEVRLITLTGPGGTGKSRLALQAAAEASDAFPDGVWWVALAPLRDPSLVLSAVAQALEVREEPSRELAELLVERLGGKKALLLLDNAEHLLPELASQLSPLVRDTGTPAWLVTSRERLQLQGEHAYAVPTLEEETGIALFLERAVAAGSPLEATEAVRELCLRLDNLPLALELAAARTVLFSPEQLVERLAQRLDLLKAGRDVDPRQQTLRATIEWSYDLLSEAEQRLFRSLSVFVGGCTYEAAEEVCGADPDTLQSLLAKSLLRRRTDGADQSRYWMLETIREYAAERLEECGEADELRDRHLLYLLDWAGQVEPELKRANQLLYLDRLDEDHENLRTALDRGLRGVGNVQEAARLAVALVEFWDIRCHYTEARAWYAAVLERRDEVPLAVAAEAIRGAGLVASRHGDQEEAIRLYAQAVRIHESAGNLRGAARALGSLAFAQLNGGEVEEATQSAQRSVAAARSDADPWTTACAVAALAATTHDQDLDEAEALYQESLRLFTEVGDSRNRAITLLNLAGLALQRRSYNRAESLLADAAALSRVLDDHTHVAAALTSQAEVALRQRRYDDASPSLREAILLGGRYDLKYQLSRCLIGVALLASIEQELESTARLVGSAVSLVERGQDFHPEDEYWQSTLLALRTVLDDDRLEQVIEESRQRPLEDAVAEALSVLDELERDHAGEAGSSGK